MLIIFILFFLSIILSSLTAIPFSLAVLGISAIVFKKSWVFFLALGLGLFFDLISVRPLGYLSLMLTIFVFLIRLYERKFETQTVAFVLISTFLGSLVYLIVFGYNNVLIQAFINALIAVIVFRIIHPKSIR